MNNLTLLIELFAPDKKFDFRKS